MGLPCDMGATHNEFQEEEKDCEDNEEGEWGCEWRGDDGGG